MAVILKRKLYDRLLQWKTESCGSTALMIDGARRVGKSYICKQFANAEYKTHIIVDFGNISTEITDLFLHETDNLDLFFLKLSAYFGVTLHERKSLIIFDEVQQFPRARQLIKYLVADGRYDYIETGSLIRLKKNVQDIIIPSEEEHIEMFPLDFEEFLWALGDENTANLIRTCFETKTPLGQSLHRKTMNDFRQYIIVGGMPQSVLAYVQSKTFEKPDVEKRRILSLYREDVAKFAPGYEDKVYAIFDGIPSQLTKKEKKYTFSSISKNARFRNYEDSFIWLSEAMIVNACYNTTDPTVALALSADHATMKCYMADTGLLVTQSLTSNLMTADEVYKAVLFDKIDINEGMLMENAVAQMLRRNGHKLYFYSRNDNKNRANHMEIDFIITKNNKICPVEVKSGKRISHSSLTKFLGKFSQNIGEKYVLYPKDVMIKDGIFYLPLYMAMCL